MPRRRFIVGLSVLLLISFATVLPLCGLMFFIKTNPALRFDRAKSHGKRLDIPAGAAVRFEPGDT